MERVDYTRNWYPKIQTRPVELSTSVVVRGVLSYLLLVLLFTIAFGAYGDPSGVNDGEPFIPLLLHAGMAVALMLILVEVYRLTKRKYVLSWGVAFFFFLLLYVYFLVLSSLKEPPSWSAWGVDLLSYGSTLCFGISALQLLNRQLGTAQIYGLSLGLATMVGGLHFFYTLSENYIYLALLPGGVLAMLVTGACGWGVFSRMKGPSHRRWWFFVTFLLYGLAQPLVPYLHAGDLKVALSTVTFILKALCAGSLIFVVLNEVWKEKELQIETARQAKEVLDQTLDHTGHGHFRTDAEGTIVDLNEAEARILGYKSAKEALEEGVGRLDIVVDKRIESDLRGKLGLRLQDFQNPIRKPDGEVAHLLTNWRPGEFGASEELVGVEGIDRDITRELMLRLQREAEIDLRELFNKAINHSKDLNGYFERVLSSMVEQTGAVAGAILLLGKDMVNDRALLVSQVLAPNSLEGSVFVVPSPGILDYYFDEATTLGNDPLALAAKLFNCVGSEVWCIRVLTFAEQRLGLALLRIERGALGDDRVGADALRHFLGRTSTAYPLVLRRELDDLRQDVQSYLYAQADTRVRLSKLSNWLAERLNCDAVIITISLWKGGNSQKFRSSSAICDSVGLLYEADEVRETEVQSIVENLSEVGSRSLAVYAEISIPVVDHEKKIIGRLIVRNPRSPSGKPWALSNLDLEKLNAIAESIGGVVETWVTLMSRIRLFDTASHEFRSPAVAIRNTADLLLRYFGKYDERQIRLKLQDISTDAIILLRQAQKIDVTADRELARGPSKVLVFRNVVFKTVRQLRSLSPSNIRFEHEGKHLIPALWAVEEELAQIVFNLIYNAIKYSWRDRQPYLKVVAEESDDSYRLRFQDQGIGVPAGWEEKIFEAEERAPNGSRHDVRGMGLGLTISRDLARKMEGDLRLTSRSEPTEFTLYIDRLATKIPEGG